MADKPELTDMALLKSIRSRIQNKQTVSTDEQSGTMSRPKPVRSLESW
jgi:hypothetical protein